MDSKPCLSRNSSLSKLFVVVELKLFGRLNALLENIGYNVKTSINLTLRSTVKLLAV